MLLPRRWSLAVVALLALLPAALEARSQSQVPDPATDLSWLPVGTVVDTVVSPSNHQQQYAAYLPKGYRRDRSWPMLVLLDPRGRALIPLERIRGVADRLGYIVLSSWNSRSDEPVDHNADAINAMLHDADRMLAIDPHRIYLVGQSGTARGAWVFGYALRENVAGIIGFGAGTPANFALRSPGAATPVFFGAAGLDDYNFDEMWALDARMDSLGLPHHIAWFDGIHAWPGAADLTEAVEYMHIQAMQRGLLAPDLTWIDSLYRSRLRDAGMMRDAGASYRAWRQFRAIEADFAGTHELSAATAARAALEARTGVLEMERHMGELARRQDRFNQKLGEVLGDLRESAPPFTAAWQRLGIDELLERSRDPVDTMGAHAASRALEQMWVYLSFYEPREYLVQHDPDRAMAMLELAERLRPGDAGVSLYRAEALARLGRRPESFGALKAAARAGALPAVLQRDANLATLRADPMASLQLKSLDAAVRPLP